ncbi:MAG TPA: NDP-sugar synthase [Candidatus Aquicultor sp.]|jgi:mannose-1-phosphate guanylyltransferase/phosphomannomutase
MRAFLLAAGLGTRLRPLTGTIPKALVPVANRPAIIRLLELLQPYNFRETYINLHFLPEDIKDVIGGGTEWDMRVHYSFEPELLGTGGAIRKIGRFLADDKFILVNTDVVTDFDISKAIAFHNETGAKATLIMADPAHSEELERISVRPDGKVTTLASSDPLIRNGVYSGIGIFEPSIIGMIPQGYSSLLHAVLIPLAASGELYAYFADGYWNDIGTIERYLQTNMDIIGGKTRLPVYGRLIGDTVWMDESAEIDLTVQIEEPVLIGKGVSVDRGATIGPYAVIGDGCSVGPGCTISHSVLWNNSQIGAQVTLDNSIIADANKIPSCQRLNRVIFQGGVSEPVFNL